MQGVHAELVVPDDTNANLGEASGGAAGLADVTPLSLASCDLTADLFATAQSPQGGTQTSKFAAASASSLAASELYAVESTLGHLLSIEESVSEAAITRVPAPAPEQQTAQNEVESAQDRRPSGMLLVDCRDD